MIVYTLTFKLEQQTRVDDEARKEAHDMVILRCVCCGITTTTNFLY